MLSEEIKGFEEVSVTTKPIQVFYEDIECIKTFIHHMNDCWVLEQGEESQVEIYDASHDELFLSFAA